MFKKFRRMKISLAAKCQILFGAAVILIIAGALAVPWRRMEQLTAELNGRAAAALADHAQLQHLLAQQSDKGDLTTQPSMPVDLDGRLTLIAPRLLSIDAVPAGALTKFEQRSLGYFRRHPEADPRTGYSDDNQRYWYASPVYMKHSCSACHALAIAGDAEASTTSPATMPAMITTMPSRKSWLLHPVGHSELVGMVSIDIPNRVPENQLLLNRLLIMVAGLLGGSLAILCFYLITTRLILQPVRVLQETAERVREGDLNIRSDISTGDEFQQLSETFNAMLTNLTETTDQLRAINTGLDLKVGQLAEANLALYESNRLKSEFLANVSHELRTPLNSILGFADLLKDAVGPAPDAKSARYIGNILQSGRALLELINDLLDLAKIEAGRMEVRSEPLSLGDLFEGLESILKPLCEPRQIVIDTSVDSNVPILQTDPGKLQQVLYNFISNAIKFSPNGSAIDLTGAREGDEHVRISVTDRGPGIEADKQAIIFEKFRQVDASVTRTHSGSGLGLAISKELTLMMGGTIGVRSAPGEGATFWIVLPLKIPPSTLDVRGRLVMC
jgi:two-component system, NarL family, sensor histidine kinase BarA